MHMFELSYESLKGQGHRELLSPAAKRVKWGHVITFAVGAKPIDVDFDCGWQRKAKGSLHYLC